MSAPRLIAALACFLAPALSLAQTPPPVPAAPNAITAPAHKTIGVPQGRKHSEALIVLNARGARLAGDRLTFDVAVLEGSLGDVDGPASVFIDTIWFGVGSGGFNYLGQSQTTGGTDPAIGSASDTSTFSGWSNPAPDGPAYRRPARSTDFGPGAPPPPDYRPTCGAPPLLPCY